LDVFFETGTWKGEATKWASKNGNFKEIYTVEIIQDVYNNTKESLASELQKRITFENKDSLSFIKEHLPRIPKRYRILFWLDAHFPNNSNNQKNYDIEKIFPLIAELKLIAEIRDGCNDIIICDDLRIYDDNVDSPLKKKEAGFKNPNDSEWKSFVTFLKTKYQIFTNKSDQGYIYLRAR